MPALFRLHAALAALEVIMIMVMVVGNSGVDVIIVANVANVAHDTRIVVVVHDIVVRDIVVHDPHYSFPGLESLITTKCLQVFGGCKYL